MFKKIVSSLLISILLITSFTYADSEKKQTEHWLYKNLNQNFAEAMFPDILESSALLDKNISEKYFNTVMKNFCSKNNITAIFTEEEASTEGLLRKDVFRLISGLINKDVSEIELPFNDVENIKEEYLSAIKKLYSLKIIKGVNNESIKPNQLITLAEFVTMLQNYNNMLEADMKGINFNVINRESLGNSTEGIQTEEKDDKILITITKAFSNSGYNMDIKSINEKDNGEYIIHLKITTPALDQVYTQVITYRKIILEIDKKTLKNQYDFKINAPEIIDLPTSTKDKY